MHWRTQAKVLEEDSNMLDKLMEETLKGNFIIKK